MKTETLIIGFCRLAGLEWQPYVEPYEISSTSPSSLRRMLENRPLSDSNTSDLAQSGASTSLVATRKAFC